MIHIRVIKIHCQKYTVPLNQEGTLIIILLAYFPSARPYSLHFTSGLERLQCSWTGVLARRTLQPIGWALANPDIGVVFPKQTPLENVTATTFIEGKNRLTSNKTISKPAIAIIWVISQTAVPGDIVAGVGWSAESMLLGAKLPMKDWFQDNILRPNRTL